jgi:hypothetical protein
MTWSQPEQRSGIKAVGQPDWLGYGERGAGAGAERHGLGAIAGGLSKAVDALPERGYTVHIASLPELRGLLHPEGHRQ